MKVKTASPESAVSQPQTNRVSSGVIRGTMLSPASVDRRFYFDPRLLAEVAARGIVEPVGGNSYRIPILLPRLSTVIENGRDCQTRLQHPTDDSIVVFKGAGARTNINTSFFWKKDTKYDVHKFHGGLLRGDVDDYVRVPLELRKLHRRLERAGDLRVAAAATWGAGIDNYYQPVAVFKMQELPVRRRTGEGMGVILGPQDDVLERAGVPKSFRNQQRVLCYVKHAPKRLGQTKKITESVADWRHAFGFFGYDLTGSRRRQRPEIYNKRGHLVSYEIAASRVLYRAAAGYGLFNYELHHHLGGAANIDARLAGVFQTADFHNVDTEGGIYDTDTVWWPGDGFNYRFQRSLPGPKGRRYVNIQHYQQNDYRWAAMAIKTMANLLDLDDELDPKKRVYSIGRHTERAVAVYHSLYQPPKKHSTMLNMRG